MSVHWSKSPQILNVHISRKLTKKKPLSKIPVCVSVFYLSAQVLFLPIGIISAEGSPEGMYRIAGVDEISHKRLNLI